MKAVSPAVACRGFTYLGVLFLVILLSMTAAMASVVWSTVQQRENEHELVFVGRQYQAAIERYQQRSRGPVGRYPRHLEELVRDPRDPRTRRDLRQLYPDPITGSTRWGLIRLADGGIVGVHSLSDRSPLQRGMLAAGLYFPKATRYRDWRFIAPSAVEALAAQAAAGPPVLPAVPASGAGAATAPNRAQVGGPPVDAIEDAPEALIQRPTMRDYRERTPEACSRIEAHDRLTCADQTRRFGEDVGRACEESAVERSVACPLGAATPLPELDVRAN